MTFKRDDWWYVDVRFRIGDKRGRYRKRISRKKKDAEATELRIRQQLAAGTWLPEDEREPAAAAPTVISFAEFAREHYLPWSELNHGVNHHSEQRRMVETHLAPTFGEQPLDKITRLDVVAYMTARRRATWKGQGHRKAKPVSPATVNRELACLKRLFRCAVEWDTVAMSPTQGVKDFKEQKNPPGLLTKDEVRRLLEALPDHLRALVGMACYAGLRRTEIFQLEWRDLNLKGGTVSVLPVSAKGKSVKTNEARHIPINPALRQLLAEHQRIVGWSLVFPNRKGGRYDKIDKQLDGAAREAGIERVRMHQLRHTFCSHCFMDGIDARTIQKWMGHKSLATTLKYAHVSPDHEKHAMEKLHYG